jgi:uncharacterized membrane protein YbhN (UPF0104 family)
MKLVKTDLASRGGDFAAATIFSWTLALSLIALLVQQAGIWNVLANTRLLDLLIEGGIIRYHDGHLGLVDGLDSLETYLNSQDPIDYRLFGLAAIIYFVYWSVKAFQFHGIARFVGIEGRRGPHVRAWIYGDGMARFIPFRFGEAAAITLIEAQGGDGVRVRQAFRIKEFLVIVFEILLFLFFGLWVTNYSLWIAQNVWAGLIFAAAFLISRRAGLLDWGPDGFWRAQAKTCAALAERPATFAKLGFLSSLAMLLDDVTPFVCAMAFTGTHVILNVSFFVIQSGVVAGYIAKRFPLTPHGIGQFEWAFAMALYYSGVGFPEAATIALIDSAVRHGTGIVMFLVVTFWYGVETDFSTVFRRYIGGAETVQAAEPILHTVGGVAS